SGLDASTVTPGRTAPDESLTTPVMEACANAAAGISAQTIAIPISFHVRTSASLLNDPDYTSERREPAFEVAVATCGGLLLEGDHTVKGERGSVGKQAIRNDEFGIRNSRLETGHEFLIPNSSFIPNS